MGGTVLARLLIGALYRSCYSRRLGVYTAEQSKFVLNNPNDFVHARPRARALLDCLHVHDLIRNTFSSLLLRPAARAVIFHSTPNSISSRATRHGCPSLATQSLAHYFRPLLGTYARDGACHVAPVVWWSPPWASA